MANPSTITYTIGINRQSRLSVIRISLGTLQHENSSPSTAQETKNKTSRHHETSRLRACHLFHESLPRPAAGAHSRLRWSIDFNCLREFLKFLDHFFPQFIHLHFGIRMAVACLPSTYSSSVFFGPCSIVFLRLLVGIYIYIIYLYTLFCIVILCFLRASASASFVWVIATLSNLFLHTLFMQKVRAFKHSGPHGLCADKDKRATEKTETHRHANGVLPILGIVSGS